MRKYGRTDDNHETIMKEVRKVFGFSIVSTASLGGGFGDVCVGYRSINGLYEIKDPAKPPSARELTKDEKIFHKSWRGDIKVALTAEDIITDMLAKARQYHSDKSGA